MLKAARGRGLLDPTGLKLDADALLQSFAPRRSAPRAARSAPAGASPRSSGAATAWIVNGSLSAPILVNAAGAWADAVAALAGVAPLGLRAEAPHDHRRRSARRASTSPPGRSPTASPAISTCCPRPGRLLVSPVDEVANDPCDAQPEDYDIAFAADRLEHYTDRSRSPASPIAGRAFAPSPPTASRPPASRPDAPGFFWLAGQGGYGLQTAPAMAEIVEALVTGAAWPVPGVLPEQIRPERLLAA